MQKIFFILLLSFFTIPLFSQEQVKPVLIESAEGKHTGSRPEFNGGTKAFYEYIFKNFKTRKKGKIIVYFIVEADGTVSNAKIVQGLDEVTDKKLLEVIEKCPKWIPGYQDGKPVRAGFNLPITIN